MIIEKVALAIHLLLALAISPITYNDRIPVESQLAMCTHPQGPDYFFKITCPFADVNYLCFTLKLVAAAVSVC